jgi:leucyl-tRNA synthetase
VAAYKSEAQKKSDVDRMNESREKTGVFTGAYVINPVTQQPIPVWIADYVLVNYGTGAIMAVPAHDERDHAFAEKFDLPIVAVYENGDEVVFGGEGTMIHSGTYNGIRSEEMREKIVTDLAKEGIAEAKVNYRMRDWLISRQRYWGAPIPIIHCDEHGAVAVPEDQLPVELPILSDFAPTGNGKSVLASVDEWVNVPCPTCGKPAKRETDTMDGYACSSWYYLRYTDAQNTAQAWDPEKVNYWMPIDYYCGGDHAVSHLLYSRFWMHVFADLGLIDPSRKEPVKKLIYNGYINAADGQKMSKSKGNVVDPLELIGQGYGADALRLYELFIAPYELDAAWDDRGIAGTYRFLNRIWTISQKFIETKAKPSTDGEGELLRAAHAAIKKVSHDLQNQGFNTAIAALMEYTNQLYKLESAYGFGAQETWHFALCTIAQLLAPFAPHITEEIWKDLGQEGSVHISGWPIHDEAYLVQHVMTIAVQVNGKLRGEIEVPHDSEQEAVVAEAQMHENVAQYLSDGIRKTIYVPGKIVNFVV